MSNLSTLPKGDSAWLLRKAIQRIIQQVSVLETNIGSSTTGNSANTQVIFNDNGVLRGDTGLTFNAATDLLTVGAATISGDLTVDTNTLKVDSANNRVGIGTASPAATLIVRDGLNRNLLVASDATQLGSSGIAIGGFTDGAAGYAPLSIISSSTQFGIGGTTAMTLNSTGLGIGVTPSVRLDLLVADVTESARFRSTSGWLRMIPYQSATDGCRIFATNSANTAGIPLSIEGFNLRFNTNVGNAMILDNLGNIILSPPTTPPALGTNGQLTFTATSNTNLRFSYRGSDGTTRVADITLA